MMLRLLLIPCILVLALSCEGNKNSPRVDKTAASRGKDPGLQRQYTKQNVGPLPRLQKEDQLQNPASSFVVPSGWRKPTESDYADDWESYRDEIPVPYHIDGDFNGDGRLDQAWILIKEDDNGWGLFAFINRANQSFETVDLIDSESVNYTSYGISVAAPGEHETACGKGHWDCGPGEVPVLILANPAISFFKFESFAVIYYWDTADMDFKGISISD